MTTQINCPQRQTVHDGPNLKSLFIPLTLEIGSKLIMQISLRYILEELHIVATDLAE